MQLFLSYLVEAKKIKSANFGKQRTSPILN